MATKGGWAKLLLPDLKKIYVDEVPDDFNIIRKITREMARAAQERLEREAWEILKEAGDVNQGEAPVVIEDVVCTKETEKALLVGIDMIELWIPKSALHATSQIKNIEVKRSKLVLKYWFARKVGLL